MAIAALGMFNVTNQYTFGAIFQHGMGAKGDVGRRRELVADVILGYLTKHRLTPDEEDAYGFRDRRGPIPSNLSP
jgi:hypothetical protein